MRVPARSRDLRAGRRVRGDLDDDEPALGELDRESVVEPLVREDRAEPLRDGEDPDAGAS